MSASEETTNWCHATGHGTTIVSCSFHIKCCKHTEHEQIWTSSSLNLSCVHIVGCVPHPFDTVANHKWTSVSVIDTNQLSILNDQH